MWLNEGLAKFYDAELMKLVMPEETEKYERHWQMIRFYAYIVDNQVSTIPLNHYVEKIEDINSRFDNIIYHKAACIIQMFQGVVGVKTWKKGITYYLQDNEYSAVEPNDLHKAVQKSLDEDFPGSSLKIEELMSSWEDHAGYPKLSVRFANGILKLTQIRDIDDEELQDVIYNIPITYTTSKSPNFEDFTAKLWMTEREMEIKDFTDNWIVFNNQQNGYYKVDYDENLWNRIINQLHANYSVIHHINREWLSNFRLYRLYAEDHDSSTTLRYLTYLKQEDNVNVLTAVQTLLRKFLDANEKDEAINAEVKKILEVVYRKVKDQTNINTIKSLSHQLRVQDAIDDSIAEMIRILDNPQEYTKAIFFYGLVNANETIIDKVLKVLRNLHDTGPIKSILFGLGAVQNAELYNKVLNVLIERGNEDPQHFYSWITNIETEERADIFLTFLDENFPVLQERSRNVLEFLLTTSESEMKTEYQKDRLKNIKIRLNVRQQ